jgi:CDP-diacylglycerol pyrophosphatase
VKRLPGRRRRVLCATGLLAVVLTACASASGTASGRDVLWRIVTECVEPTTPGYCARCRWPLATACAGEARCEATTELWDKRGRFVAIRDIKMCGCPADFVHGLVIPRARVVGIEDPGRPQEIWSVAWDVARSRIADASAIALAVNARRFRTQDQLHVHIVQLLPGARRRVAGRPTARVARLDAVWETADRLAGTEGLSDYGVLVAQASTDDFLVLVDPGDVEREFTESRCR